MLTIEIPKSIDTSVLQFSYLTLYSLLFATRHIYVVLAIDSVVTQTTSTKQPDYIDLFPNVIGW